ncbi:Phosphate-regulating neutral endopeptidase [Aphelenchoides fujianensis]|nr:Phosphate-regulating neutral endopeptidase [Aphelenchoides fujianensis]
MLLRPLLGFFLLKAVEVSAARRCADHVSLCQMGHGYCWDFKVGATVRENCPRMCNVCTPARTRHRQKKRRNTHAHRRKKPAAHRPHRCVDHSKKTCGFCGHNGGGGKPGGQHGGQKKPPNPTNPVVGPAYEPFVLSIDPAVSACTDFYEHACGRWRRAHPLREGVHERTVLSEAQRSIDKQMEALIDTNTPATAEETQMKRFFDLCLDEPALPQCWRRSDAGDWAFFQQGSRLAAGGWPLLGRVGGVDWNAGAFNLGTLIALLNRVGGVQTFLRISTDTESRSDSSLTMHVTAGNLGMPPADFADAQKLGLYRNYLTDLLMIVAGDVRSPRSADQIRGDLERAVDFERQFAAVVERHNAAVWEDAAFTTLPNEFVELLRSVSTDATFQPFLTTHTSIRVKDLAMMRDLDALIQATQPAVVADYVLLHYLDRMAPFLDRRFVDVIEDRRANRRSEFERRRYCTDLTRRLFHELTDQLYIRSFLPAGTRTEVVNFVEHLRTALIQRWPSVSWMTAADRAEALEKLRLLRVQFATPATRTPVEDGYAVMNFAQFAEALQRLRETQEFRALERGDSPNFFAGFKQSESQVMNDIDLNLLFVTAAFAQSPFFHPNTCTAALNYGSLGTILSHFLGDTVNTKGRFRDSRGGQREWWTGATDRQYAASSQCLVDRFSATPVPELGGTNIDGRWTLEENAGEYLGIKTAYDAYKKNAGTATAPLPGFSYTQDQIFFASYAMANCANRDAEDIRRLMGGGWSPEHQRVNLLLANTPAFARAFNCPTGAAMNANPKC